MPTIFFLKNPFFILLAIVSKLFGSNHNSSVEQSVSRTYAVSIIFKLGFIASRDTARSLSFSINPLYINKSL